MPTGAYRVVRTRDGFRMRVRLGDWLGRHVYVTGEYEPATTDVIRALVARGDTVVDVGANAGYFTLLTGRHVGSAGRVYAFEPLPAVRDQLVENVRLNAATQVVVRPEALADAPGEVAFYVGPTDHMGVSSLRPVDGHTARLTLRTGRLDDLLPPDVRVGLVKIDVEGAEYLALRGMEGRLRRDRPDIVAEVTDTFLRELGHSTEMLFDFLLGLGYRAYRIETKGLRPVTAAAVVALGQSNVLFTARPTLPAPLRTVPPDGSDREAGTTALRRP